MFFGTGPLLCSPGLPCDSTSLFGYNVCCVNFSSVLLQFRQVATFSLSWTPPLYIMSSKFLSFLWSALAWISIAFLLPICPRKTELRPFHRFIRYIATMSWMDRDVSPFSASRLSRPSKTWVVGAAILNFCPHFWTFLSTCNLGVGTPKAFEPFTNSSSRELHCAWISSSLTESFCCSCGRGGDTWHTQPHLLIGFAGSEQAQCFGLFRGSFQFSWTSGASIHSSPCCKIFGSRVSFYNSVLYSGLGFLRFSSSSIVWWCPLTYEWRRHGRVLAERLIGKELWRLRPFLCTLGSSLLTCCDSIFRLLSPRKLLLWV